MRNIIKIIFLTGLAFVGCSKMDSISQNKSASDYSKTVNGNNIDSSNAVTENQGTEIQHFYLIGDTKILVSVLGKPNKNSITYFNVHDNEKTSVEAAKKIIPKYGGELIEMNDQRTREIKFSLEGRKYDIDPNRIFTVKGINYTLNYYNNYSQEAFDAVNSFQTQITKKYFSQSSQIVISLHNNTESNYSILSYIKGGEFANDASSVNINKEWDTDDFFFVTDTSIYNEFKKHNVNVALQNNEGVKDDGSFSVYCGYKKIQYMNVEAQHGHLQQQIKMLEIANEVISELSNK